MAAPPPPPVPDQAVEELDFAAMPILAVILVAICFACVTIRRRQKGSQDVREISTSAAEPWELTDFSGLEMEVLIGQGGFASVWRARHQGTVLAGLTHLRFHSRFQLCCFFTLTRKFLLYTLRITDHTMT